MCMSLDPRVVSRNLRRLMAENGLTVRDVQTHLGLESSQAVYKWLTGKCIPTTRHLYALSLILHTTMETILTGDGQDVPVLRRNLSCLSTFPRNTSTFPTYAMLLPAAQTATCS